MKTPYRTVQMIMIQFQIKRIMIKLNELVEELVIMRHLGQSRTSLYKSLNKKAAMYCEKVNALKIREYGLILKY